MKPARFDYYDPSTIEDAVGLLGRLEDARPIAGGQSLVPMMNFRYATPAHIIDLNGIASLSTMNVREEITIGAMTRQREIEFSAEIARLCPILQEALLNVGHRQTRNRGTIGGSLCHLDPAAELPAILLLHDATLQATSTVGRRDIAMSDFSTGYMCNALEPGDLLTSVSFKAWGLNHGYAFEEYARRHGDFAIASVGALIEIDQQDKIKRLALVVGGLGNAPSRLTAIERSSTGNIVSEELIEAIAHEASEVKAMDDAHVSAVYRQHLASVLADRAMRRAVERARERLSAHV